MKITCKYQTTKQKDGIIDVKNRNRFVGIPVKMDWERGEEV